MNKKFIIFLMMYLVTAVSFSYEYGDITAEEQYNIELINRARSNPQKEAERMWIDLNEGLSQGSISNIPKQPLVSNSLLYKAAKDHCIDMDINNYFSHTSLDGRPFYSRIYATGYSASYIGENIASTSNPENAYNMFFIDNNVPSRGHRVNMMKDTYNEIGVGTCNMLVQDFGYDSYPAITGVVYDDKDSNSFYSIGEGINNITISVNNFTTKTGKSGGYAIKINSGKYDVIFTHPEIGQVTKSVIVKDENVKLDILYSEFKKSNNAVPQNLQNCSIYNSQTAVVSIPCVSVNNINYKADLQFIDDHTSVIKSIEELKK